MNIQIEIERREDEFVAGLRQTGNKELASRYADIITLRKAAEVLQRSEPKVATSAVPVTPEKRVSKSVRYAFGKEIDDSFNLRDVTRQQIKEFGQQPFTTRQILEALKANYPEQVTDKRLPSVSATLANLFTKKELSKSKDQQGKMTFQSLALE